MGNLVTKLTTNNMQLNESGVSDVVFEQVRRKMEKLDFTISILFPSFVSFSFQQVNRSPPVAQPSKQGLFKNLMNFDPRSPSTSILRTPIAMFRSNSGTKFNHQVMLNESIESQIEIDILTPEEQDSLDSNTDLAKAAVDVADGLEDPR